MQKRIADPIVHAQSVRNHLPDRHLRPVIHSHGKTTSTSLDCPCLPLQGTYSLISAITSTAPQMSKNSVVTGAETGEDWTLALDCRVSERVRHDGCLV